MKVKNLSKKLAVMLMAITMLSGCGNVTDDDNMVMIEQEREEIAYELAAVTVGDVEKTMRFRCDYVQEADEDISFSLSGKRIASVYVKEGDHVEKGQLLAELSGGNLETEIERLEYQITRNKLLLEYSIINENDQISTMWLNHSFGMNPTWEAELRVRDSVAALQQSFEYNREDYQDAIALDELQLKQMKDELNQSRVYAGMSGTVSWLKDRLEGSTSVKDEKIMTIIDSSKCLFETRQEAYSSYFTEGMELPVNITSGTGAGSYTVVPYQMDSWGEKQKFKLTGEGSDKIIEIGAMGTMRLVIDKRESVLNIPTGAVHEADGKTYVYVLGENNMREIKWIETGLYGDQTVEVVSGLTRGEKVVLK